MDIKRAVSIVGRNFRYRADQEVSTKLNGDPWMIMEQDEEGLYHGDCEDFSLTAIYLACDKSILKFLFNVLVTKKYKLYACKTDITGENHCVGNLGDIWFDNFSKEAIEGRENFIDATKHRELYEHNRIRILLNLYSGFLLKLFGCKKSTSYFAAIVFNLTLFSSISGSLIFAKELIQNII